MLKKINRFSYRIAIAFLAFGFFFPSLAMATDQTDLSVGLKTLPMLEDAITGTLILAIVYDPDNAESKSDADAIKAAIDGGIKGPGGIKISGLMVPASDISSLSKAKVAFVARGTSRYFDKIASTASTSSILTISTDLECVRSNKCVLGIISKPTVEIYYSHAAGEITKVGFDPAFIMLVKKV